MAVIGINTWVWTSPLTSGAFRALAPHLASMGFDLVEVPIEQPGDFDYREAGRLARDIGLAVSVAAVIGTDRDLLHADASVAAAGAAYVRHCVDAAVDLGAVNIVGPFYSGVGRTWRCTPDERDRKSVV